MKIAVNSRLYAYTKTGVQRYIENTYKSLAKNHPELDIVYFQTTKTKSLGRTITMPTFLGLLTPFDFFLVIFLILKERPDVFHGPMNVLPVIKIPGVKYVLTVHDCTLFTFPEGSPSISRWYFKFTLWVSIKNADVIFVVSENTKKDIMRIFNVPSSKIYITYCGFDSLPRGTVDPSYTRTQPFFLAAVTHPKRKNIIGALKAFSIFSKAKPEHRQVEFVCVGSISEEECEKLKQLCVTLGIDSRCHFLGFVDDAQLQYLYTNAIALVYPSFYEGFGMPPLEALFLGSIPIVSDSSSLPEVVPFPELRFNTHSEASIAHTMDFVFSLSKDMRVHYLALLKEHAKKFNWDRVAEVFWEGIQY